MDRKVGIPALVSSQVLTSRKTRSGRSFSLWNHGSVKPATDGFDLTVLLQSAVAKEEELDNTSDGARTVPGADTGREEVTLRRSTRVAPIAASTHSTECSPLPSTSPEPTTLLTRDLSNTSSSSLSNSTALRSSLTGKARQIARKKAHGHRHRQRRRAEEKAEAFSAHKPRAKITEKYVAPSYAQATSAGITQAKVARTAYVALHDKVRDAKSYTLEELVGPGSTFGFKLVKYKKGTPIPIVSDDEEKYVIAVFADTPNDERWPELVDRAAKDLEDARKRCDLSDKDLAHRRGRYGTLTCGVSHGGGQKEPGNLCNNSVNAKIAEELNGKEPFRRFAGFATSVMASWAPRMHAYYVDRLGKLHAHSPHLRRNFTSSVFAANTYNLGPYTATVRHLDSANLAYGWCAVTALGDFDHTVGGHLVLWDAGLVIEFPAGTTILLPSAILNHSNIGVRESERRYSFTQYSAGALFRWVDNGFQRMEDYLEQLEAEGQAAINEHKAREKARWRFGLSLFSTIEEIALAHHKQ